MIELLTETEITFENDYFAIDSVVESSDAWLQENMVNVQLKCSLFTRIVKVFFMSLFKRVLTFQRIIKQINMQKYRKFITFLYQFNFFVEQIKKLRTEVEENNRKIFRGFFFLMNAERLLLIEHDQECKCSVYRRNLTFHSR